jgi:hypothetical protein
MILPPLIGSFLSDNGHNYLSNYTVLRKTLIALIWPVLFTPDRLPFL